jgi:putative transposase
LPKCPTGGCAEFCVNGQSTAGASRTVRKHNEHQETRRTEELLSGLLANYKKPEDLIGENGLLKQLTKLLVEKALDAELTEHLGHDRHESVANASGNTRNGKSKKTLKGDFGELPIEVPRDRHGSFEPQLIPKHQTRWTGFDDKIISLYARGMTVREIGAHLQEMYGTEVSPSLISSVTDAVSEEVKAWQARPLDPIYPIVYLDCIHVKVREGAVRVKAVYLAIGITMEGNKEVLGLWLAQTEGPSSGCRWSPSCATGACRTSSSPALMVSRASRRPSRRCSPRPWCSCASCTWCATA